MSWAELSEKFRDCAALVLPRKSTEEVVRLVGRLPELRSLAPLLHALAGGKEKRAAKSQRRKLGSKPWSRTRKR